MLEAIEQLAAKIEADEGTAIALSAADAVLHAEGKFTPDVAMNPRPLKSSSLSQFSAVPGKRSGAIGFKLECKGSGTPGTPPEAGKFLRACGMQETIAAGVSVTYTPATDTIPAMTLALYQDGMISQIWGARGTWKLNCPVGEPAWWEFEFTGADFSVADGNLLTGVSFHTTVPPAFVSASLTIDSYAALISTLSVDCGNAVALRSDANTSSGNKSAVITARPMAMTFDPEKVLAATYDFYTKLRAGTEGALSFQLGASAGNICTVGAPKVQYTKVDDTAKDAIRSLGIDCQLNRDSGDDEVEFVFT